MNKTISLIAIVTGLVLTSCGSLQTISFEQLQAADVSFPDAVRNVARNIRTATEKMTDK